MLRFCFALLSVCLLSTSLAAQDPSLPPGCPQPAPLPLPLPPPPLPLEDECQQGSKAGAQKALDKAEAECVRLDLQIKALYSANQRLGVSENNLRDQCEKDWLGTPNYDDIDEAIVVSSMAITAGYGKVINARDALNKAYLKKEAAKGYFNKGEYNSASIIAELTCIDCTEATTNHVVGGMDYVLTAIFAQDKAGALMAGWLP